MPSALGAGAPSPKTAVSNQRTQISETSSTLGSTSDPVGQSKHPIPDDLRTVVEAWPGLPEAVRVGIVAMVEAASRAMEKGS